MQTSTKVGGGMGGGLFVTQLVEIFGDVKWCDFLDFSGQLTCGELIRLFAPAILGLLATFHDDKKG